MPDFVCPRCHAPNELPVETGIFCECIAGTFNPLISRHGTSESNPCRSAHCFQCGWMGQLPSPSVSIPQWMYDAINNSWRPPKVKDP